MTRTRLTSLIAAAGGVLFLTASTGAGSGGHGPATEPAPAPVTAAAPKPTKPASAPAAPEAKAPETKPAEPTPAQALQWLTEGNARFAAGASENPNVSTGRISETAPEQHPFASILSCADSRCPVERVFDRGIGDLFVIRVAGNVCGTSEMGTIEYGTGHLKTPLLVVMGHTGCGAVKAAASNAEVHGAVAKLLQKVKPAVDTARSQYPELTPEQLVPVAVRANVWESIHDVLNESDEVRDLVKGGKLKVVGAVYDINTGKVHWLGEHPGQAALVMKDNDKEETVAENTDEAPATQPVRKAAAAPVDKAAKPANGKPSTTATAPETGHSEPHR